MSIVKQVINKEYNQFKEELTSKMWEKLDSVINQLDEEVTQQIAVFKQDS